MIERVQAAALIISVVPCIEDFIFYSEFLAKLIAPLLSNRRRANNDDLSLSDRPILAENQSGFDCFSEADLIRKNHAFGQWGLERK